MRGLQRPLALNVNGMSRVIFFYTIFLCKRVIYCMTQKRIILFLITVVPSKIYKYVYIGLGKYVGISEINKILISIIKYW